MSSAFALLQITINLIIVQIIFTSQYSYIVTHCRECLNIPLPTSGGHPFHQVSRTP